MAVWSLTELSSVRRSFGRFDAEFYRPESLDAFRKVTSSPNNSLGRLVVDGYRVVYENTKILAPDRTTDSCARFLQATNISQDGLSIDLGSIGCVHDQDWVRYPKGRISPGELLIEVKGQAEKVAVVPDDFPKRTLVSGSLFKAAAKSEVVSSWYLFLFLSSRYGKLLRNRLKTNTLIGFVSKPQLYSVPVYVPDQDTEAELSYQTRESFRLKAQAHEIYTDAKGVIESELGLKKFTFQKPVGYTASFSELETSRRLDPEHFYPEFKRLQENLPESNRLRPLRRLSASLKTGIQPAYGPNGQFEVINSKHIGINAIDCSDLRRAKAVPLSEMAVRGDILLNATGRGTLGRCAVLETDNPKIFDVCIIRIRPLGIDPYFLAALLNTKFGQLQMELHTRGTSGQLHLYPRDAEKIKVWDAPITLQTEIRDLMVKALESERQAQTLLEEAKQRVEQLIEEAAQT